MCMQLSRYCFLLAIPLRNANVHRTHQRVNSTEFRIRSNNKMKNWETVCHFSLETSSRKLSNIKSHIMYLRFNSSFIHYFIYLLEVAECHFKTCEILRMRHLLTMY